MKYNNLILITLNNTLHIKADNLEPVEVDSSLWDFLYHNPHTWNWNADLSTINVDHLLDRIEVREETTHHKSDVVKTYKAFLLPVKEIDDSLNVVLDNQHEKEDLLPDFDSPRNWTEDYTHENGNYINRCSNCKEGFFGNKRRFICKECDSKAIHIQFTNKKSYTIEEIEKAIRKENDNCGQPLTDKSIDEIINNLKK